MSAVQEKAKRKPILCLDFDGVIHSYIHGWQGATTISDPVTDGFFEWAKEAQKYFTLVIYSSRSKEPGAIEAMELWLELEFTHIYGQGTVDTENSIQDMLTWFTFAHEKPAAFLTIDDRGFVFKGRWDMPEISPGMLLQFKPWNY